MFHQISKHVIDRMQELEERDARERRDGTPRIKRLRQVVPETGRFIAFLAILAPPGAMLEIGTSGGYSALWLSLAAKARGGKLVTFELLPEKIEIARETFKKAKVEGLVEVIHGDARGHLSDYEEIAFCFMDAEKEMYEEVYDQVVPNLVSGGLFVVDNTQSHKEELSSWLNRILEDESVDMVDVPVGKGVMVCRKV
jgi:predicted O-methyltransferase YrrM